MVGNNPIKMALSSMLQRAEQAKLTMTNVHVNKSFVINIIFNAGVESIGIQLSRWRVVICGYRSCSFMVVVDMNMNMVLLLWLW